MRPVRQPDGRVPFRDHVEHQRLGELVLARTAQFLGPPFLLVHTRLKRVQHLARHAIHVIDDLALLIGQQIVCLDGLQIGLRCTVLTVHGFPPERNVRLLCSLKSNIC